MRSVANAVIMRNQQLMGLAGNHGLRYCTSPSESATDHRESEVTAGQKTTV